MSEAASHTEAAFSLGPAMAKLGLVESGRGTELIIAMREAAVLIRALLPEEIEAELCFAKVWSRGKLLVRVSEATQQTPCAPAREEMTAHASLAELFLHVRCQRWLLFGGNWR
jgi:hypothetical protein